MMGRTLESAARDRLVHEWREYPGDLDQGIFIPQPPLIRPSITAAAAAPTPAEITTHRPASALITGRLNRPAAASMSFSRTASRTADRTALSEGEDRLGSSPASGRKRTPPQPAVAGHSHAAMAAPVRSLRRP